MWLSERKMNSSPSLSWVVLFSPHSYEWICSHRFSLCDVVFRKENEFLNISVWVVLFSPHSQEWICSHRYSQFNVWLSERKVNSSTSLCELCSSLPIAKNEFVATAIVSSMCGCRKGKWIPHHLCRGLCSSLLIDTSEFVATALVSPMWLLERKVNSSTSPCELCSSLPLAKSEFVATAVVSSMWLSDRKMNSPPFLWTWVVLFSTPFFFPVLVSFSVFMALSTAFHSTKFSRRISAFSLCSSGLISAFLTLSPLYIYL